MDKQNRNILAGILVIGVILIAFNYSQDKPIQTNEIVVLPESMGTVDGTMIECPDGYTVVSTVGGTPDQPQVPKCQAPYPSIEQFDCGDSITDADGNVHIIECTTP